MPKGQRRYAPRNRLTSAAPRRTIRSAHSISVRMPTSDRRSFPLIRSFAHHVCISARPPPLRRCDGISSTTDRYRVTPLTRHTLLHASHRERICSRCRLSWVNGSPGGRARYRPSRLAHSFQRPSRLHWERHILPTPNIRWRTGRCKALAPGRWRCSCGRSSGFSARSCDSTSSRRRAVDRHAGDGARTANLAIWGASDRRSTRRGFSQGRVVSVVLLYFLLLRATALSFSGFASVPVIREDLSNVGAC